MKTPASRAVLLHAWFLAGCAAACVAWNTARAHDAGPGDGVAVDAGPAAAMDRTASPDGAGLAPAEDRARRKRAVFVCRDRGVVIYSDLPCGEHAEERVLRVHEPAPGRVASTVPLRAGATTRPRNTAGPGSDDATTASERCRRIREQLETLDDRMRAGYPARGAAELWERWRDLNDEIYAARCRRP